MQIVKPALTIWTLKQQYIRSDIDGKAYRYEDLLAVAAAHEASANGPQEAKEIEKF